MTHINKEHIEHIVIDRFDGLSNYASRYSGHNGLFGYARLSFGTRHALYDMLMSSVLNFEGLTLLICTRGVLHVEVNLKPYTMVANSILMLSQRTLVRYTPQRPNEECEIEVLFLSTSFLHTVSIDLSSINTRMMSPNSHQLMMRPEEARQVIETLDLLHHHTQENAPDDAYFIFIARSLVAAIVYQLMQFAERRFVELADRGRPRSRRINYVQQFMRLVHLHYRHERSIAFYAEHLCISSKYLSLVIRQATGRTATDIINDFVITDAKNLLKYSGKNIQQIAYELNFNNQSAFGKYFKHLTGMSPTHFQTK